MNVLIANWTWYESGGDWTYIKSVCDVYEKHGHHIIPFSMKNERNFPTPYDKYFIEKIDYKELNKNKSLKTGFEVMLKSIYSVEAKRKLEMLLDDHQVDIAQLNNINNYLTPSIIPVLKKRNIPVVWRVLDYKLICPNTNFVVNDKVCEACFKHKYYNCVLNRCKKGSVLASAVAAMESYVYWLMPHYRNVDLFLFQSEFTRDMFVKYGFDPKKTHIIENSYDGSNIKPVYTNKGYILFFGRIERMKGIYTLINAMKRLPDVELKIIGIGTEHENSMAYAAEQGITNVSFLGPKWNDELADYLSDCKFVVVPSELHDPSPYVVLQSFAFGKPVVSTRMGGLRDMITDNVNGVFFDSGDPESLAQAIRKCVNDPELVVQMGKNARQTLEQKHNPERYYQDTIQVFEKLINHQYNN